MRLLIRLQMGGAFSHKALALILDDLRHHPEQPYRCMLMPDRKPCLSAVHPGGDQTFCSATNAAMCQKMPMVKDLERLPGGVGIYQFCYFDLPSGAA